MDRPLSILCLTFDGGGNVPPVFGAMRALVERGANVTILTEPCLQRTVAGIGAGFRALTGPVARTDRSAILLEDWRHRFPPHALRDTLQRVTFGPMETHLAQLDAAIAEMRPDIVVTDWLMPAGVIAAEAHGLPVAVLMHCTDMRPRAGRPAAGCAPARGPLGWLRDRVMGAGMHAVADRFLREVNRLRRERDLAPLRHALDIYDRAGRVLVQSDAHFDLAPEGLRGNTLYTGAVGDEPDWTGAMAPQGQGDRPLVLGSLSSTFQNQAPTLQAMIGGLGHLVRSHDVRVVVTTGPAMARQAFDVPQGVEVVESAPHGPLLDMAAAFVSHCGHGSVMRALARGVPVGCLPMGRDQGDVAARVVHHGAGLRLRPRAGAIARGVARMFDDPGYRIAAMALGDGIRTRDGAAVAADAVLDLAREHVGRRT